MIKSCIVVIRVIAAFAMTFLFSGIVLADNGTETNTDKKDQLFFTLGNENGLPDKQPINEFSCEDKVYAVMNLKNLQPGKHHLEVVWLGPDEEVRERTEFAVFAKEAEVLQQWAWLKLHRAFGASMLQLLNPAAGMEEFIGDWRVDVKVDNKLITNKTFRVIC